jgi:hypothetical protein
MRFRKPSSVRIARFTDWKVRATRGGGYVAYRILDTETVRMSRSSVLRLAGLPPAAPETLELLKESGIS